MLRPGPLSNGSNRRNGTAADAGEGMFTSGTDAWLDQDLFVTLFNGLKRYLAAGKENSAGTTNADLELSAQIVLLRLVQNQFPLFGATATESELVQLVLRSISATGGPTTSSSSSNIVARKTAVQGYEAILSAWAERCDPVLGFSTLLSHPSSHPTPSPAGTTTTVALLRSGYTPILRRLPAELMLEDLLPQLQTLLTHSLTAPTPDLRLVATSMLRSLNDKLRRDHIDASHQRIFTALGLVHCQDGQTEPQEQQHKPLLDLLMYYFSKK